MAMDPRRDVEVVQGGIGYLPDGLSLTKGAGVGLQFYLCKPWAFLEINPSAVSCLHEYMLCVLGVSKGLVYSKLFWLFDVFRV